VRLQKRSGLALNQKLPFPNGHSVYSKILKFAAEKELDKSWIFPEKSDKVKRKILLSVFHIKQ
jgi:hypothetical protein